MTLATETPGRFPSHEAAQGARRAKLAEIDLFYTRIRADIDTERAHTWEQAITESCQRITTLTQGITVTPDGALEGRPLRVRFAIIKLHQEAQAMRATKVAIELRAFLALADAETLRLAEREPYDFGFATETTDALTEPLEEN